MPSCWCYTSCVEQKETDLGSATYKDWSDRYKSSADVSPAAPWLPCRCRWPPCWSWSFAPGFWPTPRLAEWWNLGKYLHGKIINFWLKKVQCYCIYTILEQQRQQTVFLKEPHHRVRVKETPPTFRACDGLLHIVLKPFNGGTQLWNQGLKDGCD